MRKKRGLHASAPPEKKENIPSTKLGIKNTPGYTTPCCKSIHRRTLGDVFPSLCSASLFSIRALLVHLYICIHGLRFVTRTNRPALYTHRQGSYNVEVGHKADA